MSDTLTQPLVHSAMNGFNGTLMAYGQTGSGKTYSLMSDDGITKTLIDKCFEKIYDDTKHNYKVSETTPFIFIFLFIITYDYPLTYKAKLLNVKKYIFSFSLKRV